MSALSWSSVSLFVHILDVIFSSSMLSLKIKKNSTQFKIWKERIPSLPSQALNSVCLKWLIYAARNYDVFSTSQSYFHLFFLFNLYFYWRITALQNFVVFCQTSAWIPAIGIHINPSLLNLPPISCPIPPLWIDTEPLFEFPEPYSKFPLAIYFTYGNVSFHVTLSYILPSPPLCPCP